FTGSLSAYRIAAQYSRLLCCSIVPPMKKLLWQMTSLFSMCGSLTAYGEIAVIIMKNVRNAYWLFLPISNLSRETKTPKANNKIDRA
ncbi:MAG: hypothetical protein ACRCZ3_13350, partial [Providencia rustigianii]|uniref:hypothetical protein n=1 Tax=Providencia rustigianii TaxID=158850 RepID=UPI003F3E9A97